MAKGKPFIPSLELNGLTYITDGKRHLVCLPYSVKNLDIMAAHLRINQCWKHNNNHYDIPKLRQAAIELRCTKVRQRDIVSIIRGEITEVSQLETLK